MGHTFETDSNSESAKSLKLTKTELLSVAQSNEKPSQSALSSLWQEAYENPYKTGLGVAAVVGTAAALTLATRGRNLNVLVIEDTPAMGLALKDAVAAGGHKVTWVTSISKLNPLTGVDEAGKEVALSGSKRFQVALLDGDLGKDKLTGPEIVSSLKQNKVKSVIGTSTLPDFNIAMKAEGAEIVATKPIIYTSLLGQTFPLKSAISNPAAVQASLDTMTANFSKPELATLRKAADKKLMSFILGDKPL